VETWKQMALGCFHAARALQKSGDWRSSVSRSYYAAYSGIADRLKGKATYPHGMHNPPHGTLPTLVMNHLTFLSMVKRRRISSAIVRMFESRVSADYRPHRTVNRDTAAWAAIEAAEILRILGVL
jgi:uncharacterized protein (UPF0332 family)